MGRCLGRDDVFALLLDEPTRGVDIGGRAAIHQLLREAADAGMVVVFASTELEELLELGDVIVTMRDGRVVGRYDGDVDGARADARHDPRGATPHDDRDSGQPSWPAASRLAPLAARRHAARRVPCCVRASWSSLLVPVAVTTDRFLTVDNGRAILASTAFVGITAIGATLVMIAGSAVSLAASQTATVVGDGVPGHPGARASAAVAARARCAGWPHRRAGRCRRLLGRQPDRADDRGRVRDRRRGDLVQRRDAGLRRATTGTTSSTRPRWACRWPSTCCSVVAVLAQWVLRRTTVGRQMYLVGENRAAARAAGIPVGRVTVDRLGVLRACIAITGIFLGVVQHQRRRSPSAARSPSTRSLPFSSEAPRSPVVAARRCGPWAAPC